MPPSYLELSSCTARDKLKPIVCALQITTFIALCYQRLEKFQLAHTETQGYEGVLMQRTENEFTVFDTIYGYF